MGRMNLVNKLHQKSVVEKLQQIDWNFGTKSPYVVELDPTTACDLACPGCISGDLLNQKDSFDNRFSNDRLVEISNELIESGVKAVILIGGGEPLSHPKVGEVIENFGKNDVQIGITTNGTFIKKHLDLIAKYASWTRVSMDAGTDETFKYLRPTRSGRSKFNPIVENMRELAKVKTGILGYSFLIRTAADGDAESVAGLSEYGKIQLSNVNEIFEAAKLAKEIGCDYFEPKPSYDDDHNLVTHSEYDMTVAKEMIRRARELEADNFKVLESINLQAALNREQIGDQPKDYTSCPAADLRTLVTPSGVYVCPYFRGNENFKIGDMRNQSLEEMWSSDHRKNIMDKLDPSCDCDKLHCIRHDTNLEVFEIMRKIEADKEIEIHKVDAEDRFI